MDANASKIKIANRALIEMGAKTISSFSEAGAAQIISAVYDDCRQEFFEEHPWSFCTRTVALATLAVVPVDFGDGALTAYAPPTGFLSIYKLKYPSAIIRQENINGQVVIVSDTANMVIKYAIDNDDPTTYTAKARLALAFKIASACASKIVGATQTPITLLAMYDKALMTAIADDSKGSTPDQMMADNIFFERMAGTNAAASVGVPGNSNNVGFLP